ncbi:MAG: hypothetical protein VYC34_08815, partial [Planctomycetota bacterium]|nr:hypothetical protein [Planctomycetota bacterium]
YLWLWENAPTFGDGNDPFRTGLLGSEIGALTRIHEPSRKAFGEIRDALENRLRAGEANMSDLCGWVSLSVALDEEDEVIAWYERVRDDPEAHESIVQNEFVLRRLLTDRGRYADAGKVLENPIGEVITSLGAARMSRIDLPNASKDQLERINAMQAGAAKQGVAETYALCLAAGRLTEARRISELLLTNYDDADARIALVSRAVKYGAPMPEHRVLLDAAEKTGVDVAALRERLERALDSR